MIAVSAPLESLPGVSKTALSVLAARATESRRRDRLFRDDKAVEIANRLGYDPARRRASVTGTGIAVRTEILDEAVVAFLTRYPEGQIVNLGAGLCTRFFRVDNGSARWLDVDLPQMQALWETLIGEEERHQFLPASVLDPSWPTRANVAAHRATLFVAEGLLMYIDEAEVKALLRGLAKVAEAPELLLEALGPYLARLSRIHPTLAGTDARFRWGVSTIRDVERWDVGARFVEEWHYLDRHPKRWGHLHHLRRVPMIRNELKVGRLVFGAPHTR